MTDLAVQYARELCKRLEERGIRPEELILGTAPESNPLSENLLSLVEDILTSLRDNPVYEDQFEKYAELENAMFMELTDELREKYETAADMRVELQLIEERHLYLRGIKDAVSILRLMGLL